jgi:ABC-2 type transport system permease protein
MLEQKQTIDEAKPIARTTISGKDAWYPENKRDGFILKQLVTKDFKLKYRRSALGVAWSVLNPLLMMIIMAAVFSRLMGRADDSIPNFPLYLILGNTAFQLMNDATSQGMGSIIGASSLLKKVKINRVVFPVEKALFAGVNYLF